MNLKDKVAIVTGSSRGLGRAIAEALGRAGAKVAVNYVQSKAAAEEIVEKIKGESSDAIAVHADVRKFGEAKKLVESTADRFSRLDILINNVGIDTNDCRIDEMTPEVLDRVLDTTLKAPFLMTMAALDELKRPKSSVVINISSRLGILPLAEHSPYGAAKAGVNQMTKVLALELKEFGIRVNAVIPLTVETDMLRNLLSSEEIKEMRKEGRIGTMKEAVELVIDSIRDDGQNGQIFLDPRIDL